MTLLAPIWLLLLVPWAMACVWAGRDADRATRVPFLSLWPATTTTTGRRTRRPPVWVILLLAAAAMTILAAAGPAWRPVAVPVAATRPVVNAGIVRFAVVDRPRPQAMVRVFNGTNRRRATVRVDGVGPVVYLPPTGQTADYFVDLAAIGEMTVATLRDEAGDRWADADAGDDTATLVRTATPGRVEPHTPLPDALARFAAVYTARRPAGPGAATVAIVRGDPPTGPAVVLPTSLAAGDDAVTVDAGHPVSRSIGPAGLATAGRSPAPPPGDGWRPLVRAGDAVLLAVRESPARQAWVGFDTGVWANGPAYVVFWADVFDWLGGGASSTWAPPPVRPADVGRPRGAPKSVAPWLVGSALGLILIALALGRRLTDN